MSPKVAVSVIQRARQINYIKITLIYIIITSLSYVTDSDTIISLRKKVCV
jgi:hypothetical protein